MSGIYSDTLQAGTGCDSVLVLDLTINNSSSATAMQTACDAFTWRGNTYTMSGIYSDTLQASTGCDSVLVLDLTINNSSSATAMQTACDAFTWRGNTYTASGIYSDTLQASTGCDSVLVLDLTINNSSSATMMQTACDAFIWRGNTYTMSGIYTDTLQASTGCDSVLILDLTINTASTGTDVQTACQSFTWIDGNTYTSSNNTATYTLVGGAANGCDSIVTLNLTLTLLDTSVTTAANGISSNETNATYQWIDCATGNALPGATNATFLPTANGSYAVVLTSGNCTDTSACVSWNFNSTTTLPLETPIKIAPNPVVDWVTLELPDAQTTYQLQLVHSSGQVVRQHILQGTTQLDLSDLPAGLYFLQIGSTSNAPWQTFKLIKQ